jgi:hypothetical protein
MTGPPPVVLFKLSCPCSNGLAVFSFLSWLYFLSLLSSLVVWFQLSCSGFLSQLSCPSIFVRSYLIPPVQTIIFSLACPTCSVLDALSLLSCPCCPIPVVLFAALSWLSRAIRRLLIKKLKMKEMVPFQETQS